MKWYQNKDGDTSSMRIMAMMSAITGCVAVLGSIAAMFLKLDGALALAGIGAGMTCAGEWAKALQAKAGS